MVRDREAGTLKVTQKPLIDKLLRTVAILECKKQVAEPVRQSDGCYQEKDESDPLEKKFVPYFAVLPASAVRTASCV